MLRSFYRLSFIFTINLLLSSSLLAKIIEEKALSFSPKIEALLSGDIHYFGQLGPALEILGRYPEVQDLDSLKLFQKQNSKVFLTKSAFIVNRPIGHFDENLFSDEKVLSRLLGNQEVKKRSANSFRVKVEGENAHSYLLTRYYDSDDMSTLPNSNIIRAAIGMKRLDVISQSASTLMITEKSKYTKYANGGVSISSFIPVLENRTLIITYELHSIQEKFALPAVLKTFYRTEIEQTKKNLEK